MNARMVAALLAGSVLVPATLPCLAQETTQSTADDVQAEDQSDERGAGHAFMEEVLVTARKKSTAERAQDVPISMSVVGGSQLEAAFVKDLTEVGMSMPNVRLDTVGAFPGVSNYTIRGMGFNSSISSVEPTVGLFVDGVYLGTNLGGSPDTLDLEAVEVLRGPQGTLFGRNVTGGAVLMRSRRPTGEFDSMIRLGLGSGERRSAAFMVEGSLTDTLAGKIFTQYNTRDGDFDNAIIGRKQGREGSIVARPILRWRPSAGVDITTILEHGKIYGDGPTVRVLNDPATLATGMGLLEPRGVEELTQNDPGRSDIEWNQVVLEANWNVGPGTIVSITGYRDVSYAAFGDTDGTPVDIARGYNWMKQHQFSEEIRYAGLALNDRLDYTVGVYYLEQELDQTYQVVLLGNSVQRSHGILDHRTASAFFQGDYTFAPGWSVTAGVRYTWEEKDVQSARTPDCDLSLNCTFSFIGRKSWNNTSAKLGLNWKVSDAVLAYASWTKGFRSGGFNIRTVGATESPGPYNEEIVKAYEVGLKTDFLNGRARVNVSAFHNKYDDLQRTVVDYLTLGNRIDNAASATVKGVELETQLVPIDDLVIRASAGYLDATYDSYDLLDVNLDGTPDPELAKGLYLVRAPKWTWSLAVTHDLSLGTAGSITTNVSYAYSDRTTMTDANSHWLDSYGLVDASVSWSPMGSENLKVSVWGKNLTNEKYALTGSPSTLFLVMYQSLPRTYGVQVDYRF